MYAVDNVKKFVQDHADLVGNRADGIIARAEELAQKGVFSGGQVEEIMQDVSLAAMFHEEVMRDPTHMEMGTAAITALD